MTRSSYRPNRTFPTEVERDAEVRRNLGRVADAIADGAQSLMPGGFMGSRKRTTARDTYVYSGPGWHLIEFGSVRSAPRAPFRRTVQSLGMKLEPSR